MPPSNRRPNPPQTPASFLEPPSPVGFANVDPMNPAAEADSSPRPPAATPDRTTPPAKPATTPASGAGPSGPDVSEPSRAPATTTAKTTSSSPASFDKPGFRKIFREAIGTLGAAANERLTRSEDTRAAGVWLADDDDKRDIGDPLGNIAVRRLGMAKWKNIEDLEDVVNLLAAGGAYVMVNVNKLIELARARRQARLAQHARVVDQAAENGATS